MEENGAPGRINAGRVKTLFELEARGTIETKRGRRLDMCFLDRLNPEYARDADGRMPSEKLATECNRLLSGFPG